MQRQGWRRWKMSRCQVWRPHIPSNPLPFRYDLIYIFRALDAATHCVEIVLQVIKSNVYNIPRHMIICHVDTISYHFETFSPSFQTKSQRSFRCTITVTHNVLPTTVSPSQLSPPTPTPTIPVQTSKRPPNSNPIPQHSTASPGHT